MNTPQIMNKSLPQSKPDSYWSLTALTTPANLLYTSYILLVLSIISFFYDSKLEHFIQAILPAQKDIPPGLQYISPFIYDYHAMQTMLGIMCSISGFFLVACTLQAIKLVSYKLSGLLNK